MHKILTHEIVYLKLGILRFYCWTKDFTPQHQVETYAQIWARLMNYWSVIPLGKGFFEFKFQSIEDMHKILALGAVNLKLGILRFYYWTKDFMPQHQVETHAQIWVKLMNYWSVIQL